MGNTPSTVPNNVRIDSINTTLTCQIFGSYDQYNLSLSTTAPVTAAAGQNIYYSDITAVFDLIPAFVSSFGSLAPNANYVALLNAQLELTNASPLTINITSTAHSPTLQSFIRFPDSGTLPPVGPVTLGSAGQVHTYSLGKVDVKLQLGASNYTIDCIKQEPAVIIGAVVTTSA